MPISTSSHSRAGFGSPSQAICLAGITRNLGQGMATWWSTARLGERQLDELMSTHSARGHFEIN